MLSLYHSYVSYNPVIKVFLNKLCAGHKPVHTWFLKLLLCRSVCACACVCDCVCDCVCECIYVYAYVTAPILFISSGVMWRDMDFI